MPTVYTAEEREEAAFFRRQGEDTLYTREDSRAAANIVEGFGGHRSAIVL